MSFAMVDFSVSRSDFAVAVSFAASTFASAVCQSRSNRLSRAMRSGDTGTSIGCAPPPAGPAPPPRRPPPAVAAGVIAAERAPVRVVADDDEPHLALRRREQRTQIGRDILLERANRRDEKGRTDDDRAPKASFHAHSLVGRALYGQR